MFDHLLKITFYILQVFLLLTLIYGTYKEVISEKNLITDEASYRDEEVD
ncbi:hypothetical protein QE443_003141 [Pantoea ananatis]|nr:hypothetical protein [Pantoea ananatis]MDR6088851.1 hypothetical protein [Pantoea ananatis]